MPPRRKRYLDNTAPADNTTSVVRPVNRMIQVKQQDTPARREKETREYQTRVERGQRIMNNFARTPAGRRAANRAYTVDSQKAKQEAAKEEAAAVVGSLFKPLMPSTYVDMAAAIKNGQVNNVTDALAAPYLSDSWSIRNPGKALVTDIAAPFALSKGTRLAKFAGRDIANSWRDMRYALAHPESQRFGIIADSSVPAGFRFEPKEVAKLQKNSNSLVKIMAENILKPAGEALEKDYNAFMPSRPVYNESQRIAKYLKDRHGIDASYQANKKFAKHFNRTYQPIEGEYPLNPSDPEWSRLFDEAIANKDLKKAFQLRLAHHKASVLRNNPQAVRFPFVHTVNDRYYPNFNAFNVKIEGKPTYVYGTAIDENGVNMSRSYASINALREEPGRTKRLLGHLENPYEVNANDAAWNRIPLNEEIYPISDEVIYDAMSTLNNRINKIQDYVNVVNPDYNLTLPRLSYGDDIPGYISNIRSRLRDAKFDPHAVNKYHRDKFFETARPGKMYKPKYPYPSFMPDEVIREEMLPDDVLIYMSYNYPELLYSGPEGLSLNHAVFDVNAGNYKILSKQYKSTRELENSLRNSGKHDGFIIDNVKDYGAMGNVNTEYPSATVYGIQNPAHIKSANIITYDDAGNMIPLHKRDNFNINDLRYGLLPFTIGGLGLSLYNRK